MEHSLTKLQRQLLEDFPELVDLTPVSNTVAVAVGIGVLDSGNPSTRSLQNAVCAERLYLTDNAEQMFMLSVNKNRYGITEARAMFEGLLNRSEALVDNHLLAYNERDNTIKNMRRLREMVLQQKWKRVILCAHIHHADRVRLTAEWALQDLEVEVVVLGVPAEYDAEATGWFEKSWSFQLREIFATLYTHLYITFANP